MHDKFLKFMKVEVPTEKPPFKIGNLTPYISIGL